MAVAKFVIHIRDKNGVHAADRQPSYIFIIKTRPPRLKENKLSKPQKISQPEESDDRSRLFVMKIMIFDLLTKCPYKSQ
jgi:hypothetical protein